MRREVFLRLSHFAFYACPPAVLPTPALLAYTLFVFPARMCPLRACKINLLLCMTTLSAVTLFHAIRADPRVDAVWMYVLGFECRDRFPEAACVALHRRAAVRVPLDALFAVGRLCLSSPLLRRKVRLEAYEAASAATDARHELLFYGTPVDVFPAEGR